MIIIITTVILLLVEMELISTQILVGESVRMHIQIVNSLCGIYQVTIN